MTQEKHPHPRLPSHVEALLDAAAKRYQIAPELARAVAWTESRGNQSAIGTSGEVGVMQLMADTAKRLGVNPLVLEQNIDGGVRLLATNVAKYGHDAGLCAYNAGPKWAQKAPQAWPRTSQDYVRKVTAREALERAHFAAEGVRTAAGPLVHELGAAAAPPPCGSSSQPELPQSSHGKGSDDDAGKA